MARARHGRPARRSITQRPLALPRGAVLEAGSAERREPAVSIFRQRAVLREGLRSWPNQRRFTVSVYARFPVWDPTETSGSRRGIRQNYGRPLPVRYGQRYFQWRSRIFEASVLVRYPGKVVPFLLEYYGGTGPVRAVSVRPE